MIMNKKRLFLFTGVLVLLLSTIAILNTMWNKKVTRLGSGEWKEYKNDDCNYQLSYPASWLIKASQYKNPCEINREAKCIASQSVWIRNKNPDTLFKLKKWLFHEPPGDIGPQDQSTFRLICQQTKYSSIEDWVRESWKGAFERIKELKFGDVRLSVFITSDPWLSRLHFIYKGHIYDIGYESGSKTQLEKDREIMEKIVQSVKLF